MRLAVVLPGRQVAQFSMHRLCPLAWRKNSCLPGSGCKGAGGGGEPRFLPVSIACATFCWIHHQEHMVSLSNDLQMGHSLTLAPKTASEHYLTAQR